MRPTGLCAFLPILLLACGQDNQDQPILDMPSDQDPASEIQDDGTGDLSNHDTSDNSTAWVPRVDLNDDFGIHYEGEVLEMLTWGPKNLVIDLDGTFWITDAVTDHLLHTERDGTVLEVIDVSQEAVGAIMMDVNHEEIAVISVASQPPKALLYSRQGELVSSYDLPMEWQGSVTGIEIDDAGQIVVQREYGYRRYKVNETDEGSYTFKNAPPITWDTTEPSNFDRFQTDPVDERNQITMRRYMGSWDGLSYIYVEEWRDDKYGQAVVDATVRMFNQESEQIGIARVDIRERYTYVDLDGVQYDPLTGDILSMMTRIDGVEIHPLKFQDTLDILPDLGKPDDSIDYEGEIQEDDEDIILSATCVSWSTMWSNVGGMSIDAYGSSTSDSWSVYSNSSTCSSRTVPRYLTGESFFGVPYSWGDCDNGSEFDSYMDNANSTNRYKAGDANDTYTSPTSCGRGTDCSGLITRAWGYSCPSGKLSTSSIGSSTYTTADSGSWEAGEVYNKINSHVVMYYGVASGSNYYWYESTVDSSYDRVVLSTRTMSYWSGYSHRRFNNQC